MTTWYAVTISPSSTRPARVIHLKRGPRNGLHRTIELDAELFQIERDLAAHGFTSFVPKDTLCIRDRKNGGEVLRTFPMLRGYAFVENPHDWISLTEVDGVTGILGSGNVPLRISTAEIASLRLAQEAGSEKASNDMALRQSKRNRATRASISKDMPRGTLVEIDHPTIGLQLATIEAATGRGTVKAMAKFLGGLVPVEIPLASVRLVA